MGSLASAAKAQKFTASQYPATLTGNQTSTHVITFGGGPKIECKTVSNNGTLTEASESFGMSVGISGCTQTILGSNYESGTEVSCGGIYNHRTTVLGTETTCTEKYTHHYYTWNATKTEKTCVYSLEDLGSFTGVEHKISVARAESSSPTN